jgi:hypothetical protein
MINSSLSPVGVIYENKECMPSGVMLKGEGDI